MSNYNILKTNIAAQIKQNGAKAITGQILQTHLLSMITSLGAGYQYMGVAALNTNPGTPDYKCFYIATAVGTYSNFGSPSLTVAAGEVAIFYYDTAWHKAVTGAASKADVDALIQTLEGEVSALGQKLHYADVEIGGFEDGYFNTNAASLPASRNTLSGCKSAKFSVTPGDLYKIYGFGGISDYYRLYAFYDSNGDRTYRYDTSATYRTDPLEVTIPSGAASMVVNLVNYDSNTDKVLVQGPEVDFDELQADIETNAANIKAVGNKLIDHYSAALLGSSGSDIVLTAPISVSQNGDSIEFIVVPDANTTGNKSWAMTSNGNPSAGYISVGAAKNRISVRAYDGTWIYDDIIVTKDAISLKIEYASGNIYVYLDGTLISTYTGQKEIRITSFGNGAQGAYGYWGGTISWLKVNGQYVDFSAQTLNNATATGIDKYATLGQARLKGVLTYNSADKYFTFYSLIYGNKFVSWRVELDQNDNDLVYLKEWRLSSGKIYEYDGVIFAEIADSLYDAENEMAMRFADTIDFTGGIHGDERIDVSPSSFVKFFAGGRLITDEDMQSDFTINCDSFEYIQYSTLHETAETENTFVAGHPIVAYHLKRNVFKDGASHLENIVQLVGTQNVTSFHAGMACMGKGVAKYAVLPVAVQSPELSGTNNDIYANAPTPSRVDLWNPATGFGAYVEGDFIEGFNNETDITTSGFEVWDRITDSKYYRRTLSSRQFTDGQRIINKQVIQIK